MFFTVTHEEKKSSARTGSLTTKKGKIETPTFMPVGTAGVVKALYPELLEKLNTQIILGNTYHLFLRPGLEIIKEFGGLHDFLSWTRPILTDSGGFQIFSLKNCSRVNRQGVEFKSHLDGKKFFLSPEKVVDIQNVFDSDIQMVLDNFASYPASREEDEKALKITTIWAEKARQRFLASNKLNFQFGIIQGGVHSDLRELSLESLLKFDFDGYAVGGLSVGEKKSEFEKIISGLIPKMPKKKPIYLMGSGTPEEILFAVDQGVDMFDCVLPTRNARNGLLFTSRGKLAIKNERYKKDKEPVDDQCQCYTCRNFSRAYLRHLYISREITASILNTLHNLHFYLDFMSKIRYSIKLNKLKDFKKKFLLLYKKGV